jgi:hypothetical protein
MPRLTGATRDYLLINISMVDASGEKSSAGMELPDATLPADITAIQNAFGNCTNAAVFKNATNVVEEGAIANLEAFDEAESSVAVKLLLTFQNTSTFEVRRLSIPAPDLELIDVSGQFAKLPNGAGDAGQVLLSALTNAVVAALNTGGGSAWVYVDGVLSRPGRQTPSRRVRPIVDEPAAGENPPPDPGT